MQETPLTPDRLECEHGRQRWHPDEASQQDLVTCLDCGELIASLTWQWRDYRGKPRPWPPDAVPGAL